MQRGLIQTVTTDRTQYPASRAVEITLRLTNNSSSLVAYRIAVRREFELIARESRTRTVVWTWSKGKPAPPAETIQLRPGEFREHRELWDRRDDSGRRVPEGTYELELIHLPFTQAVGTQIYLMERGGGDREPNPPAPSPSGGLQATIQAEPGRVRAGQSVRLTYTVVSTARQPLTLRFPTSCQCDMEVRRRPEPNARYRAGALTLWQLSRERAYLQAFTQLTLRPGERKSFTESWTVPANTPAGSYELVGYLPSPPGQKTAEATGTLTIL